MSSTDKSGTERIRRLKGITAANGPKPTKMDYETLQAIQFGKMPYLTELATGAVVEQSCCSATLVPPVGPPMIIEVNIIRNKSNDTTMRLPFSFGPGDSITVDWGDSTTNTWSTGPVSHTYANLGTYIISITGSALGFGAPKYTGTEFITRVVQWGDIQGLTSLAYAFNSAAFLVSVPTTIPSGITDMTGMFYKAGDFNGDISNWDVSKVTNMNAMFYGAGKFNGDLSWDVSKVTDMSYMFGSATSFNGDLSSWDVSKVTDMSTMFAGAINFNGDISKWDVGKVENMSSMFATAEKFNRDLSSWDANSVTTASQMFCDCPGMLASPSNYPTFNTVTPPTGAPNYAC